MLCTEKRKHSNSLSHARVEYRDQINTNLYRYYFTTLILHLIYFCQFYPR